MSTTSGRRPSGPLVPSSRRGRPRARQRPRTPRRGATRQARAHPTPASDLVVRKSTCPVKSAAARSEARRAGRPFEERGALERRVDASWPFQRPAPDSSRSTVFGRCRSRHAVSLVLLSPPGASAVGASASGTPAPPGRLRARPAECAGMSAPRPGAASVITRSLCVAGREAHRFAVGRDVPVAHRAQHVVAGRQSQPETPPGVGVNHGH